VRLLRQRRRTQRSELYAGLKGRLPLAAGGPSAFSGTLPRMKPIGEVTRGTTHPNRLRRADRWFIHAMCSQLRAAANPLCVDIGFGHTPETTIEWHDRLRTHVRPDIEVLGVDIDRARVQQALRSSAASRPGLHFAHGGFEVPLPSTVAHLQVHAIRAFNVLRQYQEQEVAAAWHAMAQRLVEGGMLMDGTCDEIGRISTWIAVRRIDGRAIAESLSLAAHVGSLDTPLTWAQRLPKSLIHHNIEGSPINRFLVAADRAWSTAAGLAVFSPRQRFITMAQSLKDQGWPISDSAARWRLGEVTVAWEAIAS